MIFVSRTDGKMNSGQTSERSTQTVSQVSLDTQPTGDVQPQVCTHCNTPNKQGSFICVSCGNLLEIPKVEKSTHVLDDNKVQAYTADHFGENSTLVLRLRGTSTAYQLTARQLKQGQIVGRNTVGQSPNAHIDLTSQQGDVLGVSRRHLHLSFDPRNQMVRVADMRSANGTHVNGQKLMPGEVRVLRHGDRLRLGKLEMAVTILHAATSIEM